MSIYFIDLKEMYNKIGTDDEGDISIKIVVEHINAVEAGRGSKAWASLKYLLFFYSVFLLSRLIRG